MSICTECHKAICSCGSGRDSAAPNPNPVPAPAPRKPHPLTPAEGVVTPTVHLDLSCAGVEMAFNAHMRTTGHAPTTIVCSAANFGRAIEIRQKLKFEWLVIEVVHGLPTNWWAVCSPDFMYWSGGA